MVGRDAEMTAIADAVKRVAGGEGREVLLVSGEAGLGKTTLVAEAARSAFDDGACVLFGHCEEDLATPYQLFAEALGHYVTHAPENQLLAHVEAHGSELSRLVPALASRIPDLPPSKATDSDTERFLLFAAVVGLLATVSDAQPVVLVLDDLQWADKGSLLLLRHLASADPPMRVLVLGTYRDSELSRTPSPADTLAALHRLNGVSRIELAGLDDTGVVAFMEAAAGHDPRRRRRSDSPTPSTARPTATRSSSARCCATCPRRGPSTRTTPGGGWPRSRSSSWPCPTACARSSGRGSAPGRRTPGGCCRWRRSSAVTSTSTSWPGPSKTGEDDLLDILDAAAAAALVRELADASGRYNFAHALIQHTLYEDMGPNRRARAHRQVAEALEELCGDRPGNRVGELARHWVAATQPIDLARPSTTHARRATPPWPPWPPPTPLATTPRPWSSIRQEPEADPCSASTWPSGSGRPSARPVTLPPAPPSSAPHAAPPTSATFNASWPPPWPTTGAGQRGRVDRRRVGRDPGARTHAAPSRRCRPGARAGHPLLGGQPRRITGTSDGAGHRGPGDRPRHR